MEIHISEKFLGDIDGESSVRALQVQRDDKFASMVSMQRFIGKLGGRHGTFVLPGMKVASSETAGTINPTTIATIGSWGAKKTIFKIVFRV